jgi:hypothetical protein
LEEAMAFITVLSQLLFVRTEENHQNLSQENWFPSWIKAQDSWNNMSCTEMLFLSQRKLLLSEFFVWFKCPNLIGKFCELNANHDLGNDRHNNVKTLHNHVLDGSNIFK